MKIRFLKTVDNAMKLRRLGASVEYYFLKKKKILITVPSEAAAEYIDDFLWKQPKESFLPHTYSKNNEGSEVVITTEQKNINQANLLINLCPGQSSILDQFETVYELWDETDEKRKEQSRLKFEAYQNSGHEVELLD